MKSWRDRYVILLKTHLLTYKENDGNWKAATEVIPLNESSAVESAHEELQTQYCFKVVVNEGVFYF